MFDIWKPKSSLVENILQAVLEEINWKMRRCYGSADKRATSQKYEKYKK